MDYLFAVPIAVIIVLLLLCLRFWRTAHSRWMFSGGLLGAVACATLQMYAVFHSTSSTAAIGILFVPLGMVFGAAIGVVLGFAGFQAVRLREVARRGVRPSIVSVASLVLLVVSVVYLGQQLFRIQSFYHYQRANNAEDLTLAAAKNLRAKDYFVLSAIAANVNTPARVLLEIAREPDPELHRSRHEWINMFDRDQLAVVRKVVRNPHSPIEVLPLLSASPDNYVLADVCADHRTPEPILRERCAPRNQYLIQWSLAGNPRAPADILGALPWAKDKYVAQGLAYNASTPLPILRELARHENPQVRQGVAVNPSADIDLLTSLSRDPVEYVARQAQRRLNSK